MRVWLAALSSMMMLITGIADAQTSAPSPDEEIAKRHFDGGTAAYDRHDYLKAAAEWERARQVFPAPAFDYNIGRAYDRLEQPERAILAYERFVAEAPNDPAAQGTLARIQVLRQRISVAEQQSGTQKRSQRKLRVAASVIAATALASLGAGGGLLGKAAVDFQGSKDGCGRNGQCAPSTADSIRPYDYAGKALLGFGAALAVTDIVLWVLATRDQRRAAQ